MNRMDIGPMNMNLELTLPESARSLNFVASTSLNVEDNGKAIIGSGTISLSFDDAIAIINWLDLHGISK